MKNGCKQLKPWWIHLAFLLNLRETSCCQTCQHLKQRTLMLSLKILPDGIHPEIGRMMIEERRLQVPKIVEMGGLLMEGFQSECLRVGIHGGKFGMRPLHYQHLSRSHFWIQIENGKMFFIILRHCDHINCWNK